MNYTERNRPPVCRTGKQSARQRNFTHCQRSHTREFHDQRTNHPRHSRRHFDHNSRQNGKHPGPWQQQVRRRVRTGVIERSWTIRPLPWAGFACALLWLSNRPNHRSATSRW